MPGTFVSVTFLALFFFFLPSLSKRRFIVSVRLTVKPSQTTAAQHRTAASERLIVLTRRMRQMVRVDGVRALLRAKVAPPDHALRPTLDVPA